MPTEMDVDAAEPRASGNVESTENGSIAESSLTSTPSDGDDHHFRQTIDHGHVVNQPVDKITINCIQHVNEEEAPDDSFISEARDNMTIEEREYVDRRMNKIYSNLQNTSRLDNNQPAEPSKAKGKGTDPRNWGAIELDEAECDPLIQNEIVNECNTRRDIKNQLHTQNAEPNALTADVGDVTSGGTRRNHEELVDKEESSDVSRNEVLSYIRDKKKLKREMDRVKKKEKTAHKKRKERAGSEPLSNELAALIQKVAEGSKRKQQYKALVQKGTRKSDRVATKPITQITSESALGRAFKCLSKRASHNPSDESSSSDDESDCESDSSSSGYSSESSGSSDSSSTSEESSGSSFHGCRRRHSSRHRKKSRHH
ncbi:hypothetical protein C0989_008475 [Termitomyces sp. Mn162]|nr:hypothetical protein C0989_008475 [Termitomyces sp. Mn162]